MLVNSPKENQEEALKKLKEHMIKKGWIKQNNENIKMVQPSHSSDSSNSEYLRSGDIGGVAARNTVCTSSDLSGDDS